MMMQPPSGARFLLVKPLFTAGSFSTKALSDLQVQSIACNQPFPIQWKPAQNHLAGIFPIHLVNPSHPCQPPSKLTVPTSDWPSLFNSIQPMESPVDVHALHQGNLTRLVHGQLSSKPQLQSWLNFCRGRPLAAKSKRARRNINQISQWNRVIWLR